MWASGICFGTFLSNKIRRFLKGIVLTITAMFYLHNMYCMYGYSCERDCNFNESDFFMLHKKKLKRYFFSRGIAFLD